MQLQVELQPLPIALDQHSGFNYFCSVPAPYPLCAIKKENAINLGERTSLWHVVILRVWIGYYLVQQGVRKFLGDFPHRDWVGRQIGDLDKVDLFPWYESFLRDVVIPHPQLFGYLVTYGEILIGLSLIAGLLTRLSAAVGAFQVGNYVLGPGMARGGSSLANSETFFIAMIVLFLCNAGRTLGIDGFLFKKRGKNP